MTLFERLNKFAGKYEFNFQMWGEGRYSIYVSKDGVDLWSCGGEETAEDAIKKTLEYLKKVKASPAKTFEKEQMEKLRTDYVGKKVIFGNAGTYEVVNVVQLFGCLFVEIYDEPPSKHIDRLKLTSVQLIES